MDKTKRRLLAVLLTALPAACASIGDAPQGTGIVPPAGMSVVRPPAVGQQWVYQVRDMYSRQIVDEVTETVVATAPAIHIQRVSRQHGPLSDEIQNRWGMLVQHPHWDPPVAFAQPMPAWPADLALTRPQAYSGSYRLLDTPDYSLAWNLTMAPLGWESIAVPAGEFKTLHYTNHINFQSHEFYYRIESERDESVWLAPQVGRWVLRRSQGSYYVRGRGGDGREDALQWELESWR